MRKMLILAALLTIPSVALGQPRPAPEPMAGPWQMMPSGDKSVGPGMWLMNSNTGVVYFCLFLPSGTSPGACVSMPMRVTPP